MKYILVILIEFCLFSCDSNKVTISKEEYRKLKGDSITDTYPKNISIQRSNGVYEDYYIVLGTDKHEYLTNGSCNNCDNKFLIHYPDCKLCKQKLSKETIK